MSSSGGCRQWNEASRTGSASSASAGGLSTASIHSPWASTARSAEAADGVAVGAEGAGRVGRGALRSPLLRRVLCQQQGACWPSQANRGNRRP